MKKKLKLKESNNLLKNKEQNTLLEEILKEVRGNSKHLNRIDEDLAKDRHDIGDFKVRLAALEAIVEELRKGVDKSAQKTEDAVVEAVSEVIEPARKEVKGLKEIIEEKKFIHTQAKTLWQRIWKR